MTLSPGRLRYVAVPNKPIEELLMNTVGGVSTTVPEAGLRPPAAGGKPTEWSRSEPRRRGSLDLRIARRLRTRSAGMMLYTEKMISGTAAITRLRVVLRGFTMKRKLGPWIHLGYTRAVTRLCSRLVPPTGRSFWGP